MVNVAPDYTKWHKHTHTYTFGRTPLDERPARRKRSLADNTQHSQQTDIHAPGGIRTRNPRKRAASKLRLRPRGHRDRLGGMSLNIIYGLRSWTIDCYFLEKGEIFGDDPLIWFHLKGSPDKFIIPTRYQWGIIINMRRSSYNTLFLSDINSNWISQMLIRVPNIRLQ